MSPVMKLLIDLSWGCALMAAQKLGYDFCAAAGPGGWGAGAGGGGGAPRRCSEAPGLRCTMAQCPAARRPRRAGPGAARAPGARQRAGGPGPCARAARAPRARQLAGRRLGVAPPRARRGQARAAAAAPAPAASRRPRCAAYKPTGHARHQHHDGQRERHRLHRGGDVPRLGRGRGRGASGAKATAITNCDCCCRGGAQPVRAAGVTAAPAGSLRGCDRAGGGAPRVPTHPLPAPARRRRSSAVHKRTDARTSAHPTARPRSRAARPRAHA
jgi:hypothetical protein